METNAKMMGRARHGLIAECRLTRAAKDSQHARSSTESNSFSSKCHIFRVTQSVFVWLADGLHLGPTGDPTLQVFFLHRDRFIDSAEI